MFESNCIAECQTDKANCIPLSSKAYMKLEACQGRSHLILKKSPSMMSLKTDFPSVKIDFIYILNNKEKFYDLSFLDIADPSNIHKENYISSNISSKKF